MELTKRLIFQMIKMSSSIQNSNLSYHLDSSSCQVGPDTRLGAGGDVGAGWLHHFFFFFFFFFFLAAPVAFGGFPARGLI